MPLSIAGQGSLRVRKPARLDSPASLQTSTAIPGSGPIADPGLQEVTPGRGLIIMAPVSVCHQVSTIGQLPPPMTSRYQIQASGLIGSPTLPRTRRLVRSRPPGRSSPHFMKVRIAVGAVYRIETLYSSTIDHQRSFPPASGVPSYRTEVAALASGP